VIPSESKKHFSFLPSPVEGMSMSHWLGRARKIEEHLEALLQRDDLTRPQRAQVSELLLKVRSSLVQQLARINVSTAQPLTKS
jgi:hypothetical protein